ncbi:hypothetical protein TNCV_4772271 [Trichonephila clavipes]|nr:hypothetical protein TNCV_4772271 [Trichonephila clavipes]
MKIRKFRESSDYRVPKRAFSSNDSNVLQKCSWKRSKQDKVAVNTNRYNLRPRGGKDVESRSAMEMRAQQGGLARSRKGRGRNDNPYIDERTRSSNRNTRRRGDQQRQDQERKETPTTIHKNQVVSFLFIFFRTSGRKKYCNEASHGHEDPRINHVLLLGEDSDGLTCLFFNKSFGFFGPELMATLFQPNPRSEVGMKDANEQAFKYRNLE